jgi:LytTr DNA-binding domain
MVSINASQSSRQRLTKVAPTAADRRAALWAYWVGFPLALGLFSGWNQIGMIAPGLPLGWAMLYWLALSAIMWAGLGVGTMIVSKLTSRWPTAPTLVFGAVLGVALTRPFHAIFQTFFVPLVSAPADVRTLVFFPLTLRDWGLLYTGNAMLMAFWIGGGLFFARFLGYAPFGSAPVSDAVNAAPGAGRPLLANRLARLNFDDVDVIQAEDHYCRLVAKGGEELVLYRFADAVAELGTQGWTRVHRSFCVRDVAIERCEMRKRGVKIIMRSGRIVDVSERYRGVAERLLA